jgi:hypothetical protein
MLLFGGCLQLKHLAARLLFAQTKLEHLLQGKCRVSFWKCQELLRRRSPNTMSLELPTPHAGLSLPRLDFEPLAPVVLRKMDAPCLWFLKFAHCVTLPLSNSTLTDLSTSA